MPKQQYKGFDSKEEYLFNLWCIEAKNINLINDFYYNKGNEYSHLMNFPLSERASYNKTITDKRGKSKIKDIFLFHPHEYTCDFILKVNDEFKEKYNFISDKEINPNHTGENLIYIDVKGSFMDGDKKNSFNINRKWVFLKYQIYIEEVIVPEIFGKFWLPQCEEVWKVKGDGLYSCYKKFKFLKDSIFSVEQKDI